MIYSYFKLSDNFNLIITGVSIRLRTVLTKFFFYRTREFIIKKGMIGIYQITFNKSRQSFLI